MKTTYVTVDFVAKVDPPRKYFRLQLIPNTILSNKLTLDPLCLQTFKQSAWDHDKTNCSLRI